MAVYALRESGATVIYHDALEGVEISASQDGCLGLVGIREPAAVSWPEDFRKAFRAPHEAPPLFELARGARRVAIIVSDSTRGVPTAKVMPLLLDELASAGVARSAVTVIVA